tara:strand:+ start:2278 stop:3540 length:1263 start_codon:yes stop_codon:yes gene_type:complete
MPSDARVAVHLCADIRHTLGASEYSFLSFLSLAMRARQELRVPIRATVPTSLGGLHLGMLFTRASFDQLARETHISLDLAGETGGSASRCDHENFDVRITNRTIVRLGGDVSDALPELPSYDSAQRARPHPAAFHGQVWSLLRAIVAHKAAPRVVRVSLSLLQATHGVLSHSSATLHAEALHAVGTLQFAGADGDGGRSARRCSYAFLGLAAGLGTVSLEERAQRAFRATATELVRLSRAEGLDCLTLNAVVDPNARAAVHAVFGDVDAQFKVSLVEKKSFTSINDLWGSYTGATSHEPSDGLRENIRERYAASVAPLMIGQAGTMWGDWLLAKRTADGLPSAVITNPARNTTTFSCGEQGRRCASCTFYRGRCVPNSRVWTPEMAGETVMCMERWQGYILRMHQKGHPRGTQRGAVLGC